MFEIYGGGTEFEQWDQGKMLINPDLSAGDRVVFRNAGGLTSVINARLEGDVVVVDVPNSLLMHKSNILVKHGENSRAVYRVKPKPRPEGYVEIDNEYRLRTYSPDWNQNDPSAPNYIKNRPFYDNGTTVKDMLFYKHGAISDRINVQCHNMLVLGETYVVDVWGKSYRCVAKLSSDNKVCIGNIMYGYELDGEYTDEPFYSYTEIDSVDNNTYIYFNGDFQNLGATDVKITHIKETRHLETIDPKYIPGGVWLEDETYTIVDNEALRNTGDDFQIQKQLERGFAPGDTVTVILVDESGKSTTASAVVPPNDGGYDNQVNFNLYESKYATTYITYLDQHLYINSPAPGTMTVMVTTEVIKTNCDLLIKSSYVWNDDDSICDVQLISGDYASVKAKIEKGLPVTAFECTTVNDYGSIKKSNLPNSFIDLYYSDDEGECIYIGGYTSIVLYPDNTIVSD